MLETDQRLEVVMGHLLRIGVTVAATVVLIGGVLYLSQTGIGVPEYQHYHFVLTPYEHIGTILAGVLRLDSKSIIQFGILLLIATPICRVLLGVVGFSFMKDRLYASVSAIVLIVLLLSSFAKK
jgi:uncharacterized membrane protein